MAHASSHADKLHAGIVILIIMTKTENCLFEHTVCSLQNFDKIKQKTSTNILLIELEQYVCVILCCTTY